MNEGHTALAKHACAACGGQAEWNPSKRALVCPFCGTEAPAELDEATGAIDEIDLIKTLREMPDDLRGWQADTRSVQCRSCHAISVFQADRVGQNCDFCGSSQLVDYQEIKAPIRPRSLLPFQVDETRIRAKVRKWFASKWLAPSRLKRKAFVDTIHGIYIPFWTFDSQVQCNWTAMSGTYYYTTQTYTDSQGKTRTRQVRHVRWMPAAGSLEHFFDDTPVSGTRGFDTAHIEQVQPFPTSDLVPYDTAYLSGFVVEHYQVVLVDAAGAARERMLGELRAMCGAQVPGDTYQNLVIDPTFSGETFKLVLVPVWNLSYGFAGKTYRLLANGYTGKIAGDYPKSGWRIFFLVLAAAVALGAIAFLVLHG